MDRVVLDTVVFVRALLNQRSVWARLLFAPNTRFQLVVSRLDLRRRFSVTRGWDVEAVFSILGNAEVVVPAPIPPTCRDPKDDKFLAAALAGGADYLVSEDRDLLVLEQVGHTRIMTAVSILEL